MYGKPGTAYREILRATAERESGCGPLVGRCRDAAGPALRRTPSGGALGGLRHVQSILPRGPPGGATEEQSCGAEERKIEKAPVP